MCRIFFIKMCLQKTSIQHCYLLIIDKIHISTDKTRESHYYLTRQPLTYRLMESVGQGGPR